MNSEREEELLTIAGELTRRLEAASVPLLADLGTVGQRQRIAAEGISPSCVGVVAAFLASEQNMDSFRRFVYLLDQLDAILGQNQKSPKAEHMVLKRELLRLLREQPGLNAAETLYVLKWVQRLLPTKAVHRGEKANLRSAKETRSDSSAISAAGFNQLAAALKKSRGKG